MKKILLPAILFYCSNLLAQNVGIGNNNPTEAGLVIDRKVGAVHAMFGSNTTGVAIESSFPGMALNTYFNGSRKFIAAGYGGLVGLNPLNGNMSIYVSPVAGTAGATASLSEALTIKPNGNIGFRNNNPLYPVTLNNSGDGFVQTNPSSNVSLGTYVGSDAGWLQTFTNHPLYFATNNGAADMALLPSGLLGIGTLAPTERLHVSGNARIDGTLKINGDPGLAGEFLVSNGSATPPTWQSIAVPVVSGIKAGLITDENLPHGVAGSISFTTGGCAICYNELTGLDPATGIFTAPATGLYQVNIQIGWVVSSAYAGDKYFQTLLYYSVSNNPMNPISYASMLTSYNNIISTLQTQSINTTLKMTAGDRLQVRCQQFSGATQSITAGGAQTHMSITRIR